MSDIPPDRRSSHELYEQFRAAGERKARVDRQVRRRSWFQRVPGPAFGAAVAFLVVGGGIAVGTKVFVSDGGPVASDPDPGGAVSRAPGDRRLAAAVAGDPRVRDARWGLRVFANSQGWTCVAAGRVVGGEVGRVSDGTFHEYPDDVASSCHDLTTDHIGLTTRPDTIDDQPRTLLYGVVDRTVRGLTLGDAPVAVAADGTYILVGVGGNAFAGRRLHIVTGAGSRTITLQPDG